MKRAAFGLALLAWGALVFWGVFWIAFPSGVVGARLAHEVRQASQGRYALSLDAVSPWWVGLAADRVILSEVSEDPEQADVPLFFGERVAAAVSPWQLATRVLVLSGYVRLGGADLDYELRAGVKDGRLDPRRVRAQGADLPLADLLAVAGMGGVVAVEGPVDVDVDVVLGQGLDKASGTIAFAGEGLRIDTVSVEALGWTDREVAADVDELDLELTIEEGEATITSGLLSSSLLDVEVEGAVDLATELLRSRLTSDVVVELGSWSDSPLESYRSMVESFLASARWADGTYHYRIDATLGRLGFSDLRPERERGARTISSGFTPPVPATPPAPTAPTVSTPVAPPPASTPLPPVEPDPEPEQDPEGEGEGEGELDDVEPRAEDLEDY